MAACKGMPNRQSVYIRILISLFVRAIQETGHCARDGASAIIFASADGKSLFVNCCATIQRVPDIGDWGGSTTPIPNIWSLLSWDT
jgi:hypothetical protein